MINRVRTLQSRLCTLRADQSASREEMITVEDESKERKSNVKRKAKEYVKLR